MSMFSVLTRKSLADVTRRKGRTVLMVLGILIGVLGLTSVNIARDALGHDLINLVAPVDLPNITFNVADVPPSVVADLQKMPNVQRFQVRPQMFSQWHFAENEGSVSLEIDGYQDWNHIQFGSFQLISGRAPGPGEIVMATHDRFIHPIALGDTVMVEGLDGRRVPLRIVGLAYTDERSASVTTGYMSVNGLEQLAHSSSGAPVSPPSNANQRPPPFSQQIMIKTHTGDYNSVQQTDEQISARLTSAHLSILFSHWYSTAGQENEQFEITSGFTILLVMGAIALLLVCFMIFNTVSIVLTEQMRTIGTMKALGGTRSAIIRSYLLSVSLYAILGTSFGLIVGLALCQFVLNIVANQAALDLPPLQFSPWVIVVSIVVGLGAPLLAALPPLWVGTGITVHQAMASYGVSTGGGKHTASWGRRLPWVPQTAWLGLRSTFRKPGRATVTLLALSVAGSVFMAAQIANESIGATTYHNLNLYTYDAAVNLPPDPTQSQQVYTAMKALPNVAAINDGVVRTFVNLDQGEMEIDSMPASSSFYHPQLVAGRWLTSGDTGTIVLSDIVAQRLGLRVGERVQFRLETARAEQVSWQIVGIVHEGANATSTVAPHVELGLAFTTPENRQTLPLPADPSRTVWLLAHDRSTSALNLLTAQLTNIFHQAGLQPNFYMHIWTIDQGTQSQLLTYVLFDVFAILIGLVGLLSLSNTLAAGVFERRLEIGILRSLGASNWRVGTVFCVEGLGLVAMAWCAGVLVGTPAGFALVNVLSYYFQPYNVAFGPLILPITLLFMVTVALLASFGPALTASRVRIAETLRYE